LDWILGFEELGTIIQEKDEKSHKQDEHDQIDQRKKAR